MRITNEETTAWVDILPIQALKSKHKDAVMAAIKLYVSLDDKGQPDLSRLPITMSIPKAQRNIAIAILVSSWSFSSCQFDDQGAPVDGTEQPLPVPTWSADGAAGIITDEDSIGELDIDDLNWLEQVLEPYLAKIRFRPDPKGTTTESSNDTSRGKASRSPKA